MYCLGTSLSVTDDWQCLRTITFCQNRAFVKEKKSLYLQNIVQWPSAYFWWGMWWQFYIQRVQGNVWFQQQLSKSNTEVVLWLQPVGSGLWKLDLVLWLCMPLERGSKRNTGHFRFEWRKVYCWCWNYETLNVINLWQPVRTTIQVFLFTSPTNTQSNTNWNISIVICNISIFTKFAGSVSGQILVLIPVRERKENRSTGKSKIYHALLAQNFSIAHII